MKQPFFGPVVTAMITPMRADGSIHEAEAARLAQWLAEHGSSALVIAGTTGEGPTLEDREKLALFKTVVRSSSPKVHVIANVGTNDTRASSEFAKRAADCGVSGIMAVGPYYNKPPQAGLLRHFTTIADSTDLPLMIYNIPGRTGVNVAVDTLVSLSAHPRIVAVKESSGDINQIAEIASRVPSDFTVYSGDDYMTLPALAVGASGVVSVVSHVAGDQMATMIRKFFEGDTAAATVIHHALLPLFRALFSVTSPIPVKAAMRAFGFSVGECRPPLCPLTSDQERSLSSALQVWLPTGVGATAR